MSRVIWWIRRDLRLGDNQALAAALTQTDVVIPVFILDPQLLASPYTSQNRLAFLFDSLRTLDFDLRNRGSKLVIQKGDSLDVLQNLLSESKAKCIFAEEDISPYARRRDAQVMRELPLRLTHGLTVHPVEMLHKSDGSPYRIFTPFSRRWHSLPFPGKPLPAPERLTAPPTLSSLGVPDIPRYSIKDV